eukprot:Sdes_comp20735_c1_seq1m16554
MNDLRNEGNDSLLSENGPLVSEETQEIQKIHKMARTVAAEGWQSAWENIETLNFIISDTSECVDSSHDYFLTDRFETQLELNENPMKASSTKATSILEAHRLEATPTSGGVETLMGGNQETLLKSLNEKILTNERMELLGSSGEELEEKEEIVESKEEEEELRVVGVEEGKGVKSVKRAKKGSASWLRSHKEKIRHQAWLQRIKYALQELNEENNTASFYVGKAKAVHADVEILREKKALSLEPISLPYSRAVQEPSRLKYCRHPDLSAVAAVRFSMVDKRNQLLAEIKRYETSLDSSLQKKKKKRKNCKNI